MCCDDERLVGNRIFENHFSIGSILYFKVSNALYIKNFIFLEIFVWMNTDFIQKLLFTYTIEDIEHEIS